MALAKPLPADDRTKHTRATGESGGNASPPRERAPRQSKTAVLRLALKRRGTKGGTPNSAFAAHTDDVVCFPSGKGCWIASKQRFLRLHPLAECLHLPSCLIYFSLLNYFLWGVKSKKALPAFVKGALALVLPLTSIETNKILNRETKIFFVSYINHFLKSFKILPYFAL